MGTSTLKSGLTSFLQKGLLNKRKQSASTLSVRRHLQSGKPNYTHYTDEEALAQSYAFTWLQIQSKSVVKLELNPRIMVMSSSPISAQAHAAGHDQSYPCPAGYRAGVEPSTAKSFNPRAEMVWGALGHSGTGHISWPTRTHSAHCMRQTGRLQTPNSQNIRSELLRDPATTETRQG